MLRRVEGLGSWAKTTEEPSGSSPFLAKQGFSGDDRDADGARSGWRRHRTRPLAHIALKILGVKGAQELAEAAVTVGLAQNMAAIPALANLS